MTQKQKLHTGKAMLVKAAIMRGENIGLVLYYICYIVF